MSETRMLSFEIDALAADRFKASWERMVLLASTFRMTSDARGELYPFPKPETVALLDATRAAEAMASAISQLTWPRTEAERRWVASPSSKGQTE